MDPKRTRARALAQQAITRGEPLQWFDELYREAEAGQAVVPWADLVPNPHLCAWLDREKCPSGLRALDIGTGLGDNAEELSRRGFVVTAFDISSSAIAQARARFGASRVTYEVGDAQHPKPEWRSVFDLVVETYTLQVLPERERRRAAESLAGLVAPNGTLVVIARGREPDEPKGNMPWPLTKDEVRGIAKTGLALRDISDFMDDEDPPVRRLVATFVRH